MTRLNPIRRAAALMLADKVDTRPVVRGATSRLDLEKRQLKWWQTESGYSPHQGARECARRHRQQHLAALVERLVGEMA